VGASYLHVSSPYSPSNLLQVLDELEGPWRPKVVFEPAPASCHPGEKEAFELVAQRVDILSPNYQELFGLYGLAMDTPIRGAVEQAVKHLLLNVGVGPGGDGIVLIRCGSRGACIGTRAGGLRWTPAYHGRDSLRVKDMTGASNAFLGGFVAGLKLTDGNPYEAALYGSVSASFVVEQYGLPRLTPSPAQSPIGFAASLAPLPRDNFLPAAVQNATRAMRLRAATGRAMWNTDRPQRRLELLRLRAATLA
jgi:sugar/nucleoside kinase (ribokinase family)